MMRSKATIKNLAELGKSPSTILQEANSRLCEGNDAEMFVTAWIGIIDLTTGVMTCANAGHEDPAIRYGDNTEYELYKEKHGFVLGGMDGVKYTEYEIKLTEGSRIFVYTDGVPEANNRSEEQFGAKRMLLALNETTDLSVNDTLKHLEQSIFTFCDNAAQFDDITMMCLEYTHKKEQ
jgi:sigma-B regulation protein RsbU (phosphoserine phosphatase)